MVVMTVYGGGCVLCVVVVAVHGGDGHPSVGSDGISV